MYLIRNDECEVLKLYVTGYNKQYFLREISRLTSLPLKTSQNTVNYLTENNILKSNLKGKHRYFRLNLENIQTKFFLLQTEIYKTMLFFEKYPFLKTFQKGLKTQSPLIVFGSFAKGTANQGSDLDIVIISRIKVNIPLHLLPCKMHEIRLSEAMFSKAVQRKNALLKEIEENHVILNNHSYFVNCMWDYYGQ